MTQVEVHRLEAAHRDEALTQLSRDSVANLFLIDLAMRIGAPPPPGESPAELLGAWREGKLIAVASLRPTIAISAALPDVLEAFVPFLMRIDVGLVKSSKAVVDAVWQPLNRPRPRRVLLDRLETTYLVRKPGANLVSVRGHEQMRGAGARDLEALIVAARESLREEDRPDPFAGDIRSFKRWVRGRLDRARVVESDGVVRCVGYADVRLREGWLIQGVYCWPEARRRGFATAGVSDLCRQAFAAGAEHVQLSVVDGNEAGRRLYEGLGFRPAGALRTILFS